MERKEGWSPAQAAAAVSAAALLGLLLPIALRNEWSHLLAPAPPGPWLRASLAGKEELVWAHFLAILPNNLGILLLAALGMPHLARLLRRAPRSLPLIYVTAVGFSAGIVLTPAGMPYWGLAYTVLSLPYALPELAAYTAAGLFGQARVLGKPPPWRLLLLALGLLLLAALVEAAVIAAVWERRAPR
uniref:Uncharacterized protein n=1 Tax=Thermus caliditerrae TaxID=1330700 RepID=A0A7C5RDS3_9DEIN